MKPTILICAMAAMMFSALAWASKPQTFPIEDQIVGEVVADCGDFLLLGDYRVEGYVRIYFNRDGSINREFYNLDFPDSIYYNEDYPGEWLAGTSEHKQGWIYYEDGAPIEGAEAGPAFKVTVPGYGVVLLSTGRFIFDFSIGEFTFVAGPHYFDEGAFDAICAVLRP